MPPPRRTSSSSKGSKRTYQYQRPWLYPKQEEAMFGPQRFAIIEASTKAGKTFSAMMWLLEQAVYGPQHANYWWVAPRYGQAKIAFRRYKAGLTPNTFETNESELTITLHYNNAVIWFKSAENPDALYGEDVHGCVIDEVTRTKSETWFAIRSTITHTRGKVRMIGNVKGRKNWAYNLARQAETGSLPDAKYFRLTAMDAVEGGIMDPQEVEDARASLPEQVFNELYLAIPSDDGGNPFGLDSIAAQTMPCLASGPPVCFGVDLAKSEDYTVVIGLNRERKPCVFERWQGPWRLTKPRITNLIGNIPALVESNGVGDPIVEDLQAAPITRVDGFTTSPKSKQQIIEGVATDLQQGALWVLEGVMRIELEAFEYAYYRSGVRYQACEGAHDDTVIALALANQHFKSHRPGGFGSADLTTGVQRQRQAEPVAPIGVNPWGFGHFG